jgi:hypothetical protein
MTELELFEKWCENQIAINEQVYEQMLLSDEPKWVIAKWKSNNNTYECIGALKSLEQFKKL